MGKIKIEYIGQKGVYYIYKVNRIIIEFNYFPSHERIIQIYKEWKKEKEEKKQ